MPDRARLERRGRAILARTGHADVMMFALNKDWSERARLLVKRDG